jgi:hypothetical protein
MEKLCQLCGKEAFDFHHLIPRSLHRKNRFKKKYTKEELSKGLDLCKMCHNVIHDTISERDLGEKHNTKKKLLEHFQIGNYVKWRRKH